MSLFAGVKREIDVKASIKDQSGKTIKVQIVKFKFYISGFLQARTLATSQLPFFTIILLYYILATSFFTLTF